MSDLHSPLYRLEAFGLRNPWVLWSLARGGLSDVCPTCRGKRFVVTSPCSYREPSPVRVYECTLEDGCPDCRLPCRPCHGSGLRAGDIVRAEDFGDEESRRVALALFPTLEIEDDPRKRRIWREDHR